ncbi:MAG: hypothetical protein WCW13_05330 [archaeon]|jgi:hypothetical protein
MKFVEVQLFLFGKPEWEFNGKFTPKIIKAKGDEIKERLYKIAEDLKKLTDNGWDYEPTLYDITFTKNIPKSTAEKELKKLGVQAEITLFEDEE